MRRLSPTAELEAIFRHGSMIQSSMKRHSVIRIVLVLILSACTVGDTPVVESTVDTSIFNGQYLLVEAASFTPLMDDIERTKNPERRQALEALLSIEISRYRDFSIENGVVRSGKSIIQEFSLISGKTEGNVLEGRAVWHEDIRDPGDMVEVFVELMIEEDILYFTNYESEAEPADTIVLIRDFQER
jgi:hypothetical protein